MATGYSAATLKLTLSEFVLPMGLTLDSLELKGEDCMVETEPFSWSVGSPGRLEAVVGQDSVQAFVSSRLPAQVKDAKVLLESGVILVIAKAKLIFEVEVRAVCRLTITDGKRLNIELDEIEPGGPVRSIVEGQLQGMNPLFDVSALPLDATLESVTIADGRLVLCGLVAPRQV